MTTQSSSSVEQVVAQLAHLENNQLKRLLADLENKKQHLPVDDHAIIDWGIGVIKAKILDEEELMCEIDTAWKNLLETKYVDFIRNSKLNNLELQNPTDQEKLNQAGGERLTKILHLFARDKRRKKELAKAVIQVKRYLYRFCKEKRMITLYPKLLKAYKGSFKRDLELHERSGKRSIHSDGEIAIIKLLNKPLN